MHSVLPQRYANGRSNHDKFPNIKVPNPPQILSVIFLQTTHTTMAQQHKDHLSDLDRHVHNLEAKVNQLLASLAHWQQWHLEYSALKEEVEQLPKDLVPRKELARIRRDFESELLTKKEINEIFGKNDLKEADQIISILTRRADYVEQNIASLNKMLVAEENRLAAATVVAYPDGGTDEETGLPITDIIEELDEDDNVVQFRLQTGGDVQPHVLDALKKAGVDKIAETDADLSQDAPASSAAETDKKTEDAPPSKQTPKPDPTDAVQAPPSSQSPSSRKSVSFAEDTKPGHEEDNTLPLSSNAHMLEELMRQAREQEAMDMSKAVIPENESPDDSTLRREMLNYSMSEIGPVVAELELDEDGSDDGNDWDMMEDEDEEDDDDDEDELGRSKHSAITDDYIKRMQELEKRLAAQPAFAAHLPRSTVQPPTPPDAGIGQIEVVKETAPSTAEAAPPRQPKSVKFASKLDVAGEAPKPAPKAKMSMTAVNPVGDIVEKTRTVPEITEEDPDAPPKRVSRFKKERAAAPTAPAATSATLPPGPLQLRPKFESQAPEIPEPAPPEGEVLASKVVERNVSSEPAEPDDMDDALLYQAAAAEYQRLRSKLIHKQGGFLKEEEQPTIPLDEAEGGPPRMSRFKAARLAKP